MQLETLHNRRDSRSCEWVSSACLTERALYVVCGMLHSCHVCMLQVGHPRCSRPYRESHLQPSAQLRLAELGLLRERLDEIFHREQPGLHSDAMRYATHANARIGRTARHRSAKSSDTLARCAMSRRCMGSIHRQMADGGGTSRAGYIQATENRTPRAAEALRGAYLDRTHRERAERLVHLSQHTTRHVAYNTHRTYSDGARQPSTPAERPGTRRTR
jgi:hypothetical protein